MSAATDFVEDARRRGISISPLRTVGGGSITRIAYHGPASEITSQWITDLTNLKDAIISGVLIPENPPQEKGIV